MFSNDISSSIVIANVFVGQTGARKYHLVNPLEYPETFGRSCDSGLAGNAMQYERVFTCCITR